MIFQRFGGARVVRSGRRRAYGFDGLEGRALLSVAGPAGPPAVVHPAAPPTPPTPPAAPAPPAPPAAATPPTPPAAPAPPTPPAPPAAPAVPLNGIVNGTTTIDLNLAQVTTATDSSGDTVITEAVPVSSTGTGTLTALGPVTLTETHVSVVTTTVSPVGAVLSVTETVEDGEATITTANGDTVDFTFSGTGVPIGTNQFADALAYTITGGTGRFAGASGSGAVYTADTSSSTDPSTDIMTDQFIFAIYGNIAI